MFKYVDLAGVFVSGVIGFFIAYYIVGVDRIDIFNRDWLLGDLWQVYVAWAQYHLDPLANWLETNRLSYPLNMPVALFDPLPLFLLITSPLKGLLPDHSQFFGVYFAFCLVIQAAFGYLLTGQLLPNSVANDIRFCLSAKLVGALFFASAPITFVRFQGHTALASHWILIVSMWGVLRFRERTAHWLVGNSIVAFIASGLNPYLTLLVVLNSSVFAVFDLAKRRVGVVSGLARLLLPALIAAAGLTLFGFASAAGGGVHHGYGYFSMNALGPVDSNGTARLLDLDVPDATGGQRFEGFQYLGLGTLIMAVLAVALAIVRPSRISFLGPALVVILISYCMALSTTVTVGNHTLTSVDIPILSDLLARFRASGRLFWIGGFWIIALSIASLFRALPSRFSIPLVATLLIVQLVDLSGSAISARSAIASLKRLQLNETVSSLSNRPHEAVVVVPPWQCNNEETPGGVKNYEFLGDFALDHKLPTNSFYAARTIPEQARYHCKSGQMLGLSHMPDGDLVLVLSDRYYAFYRLLLSGSHDCRRIDQFGGFHLCEGKAERTPPSEAVSAHYSYAQGGEGAVGLVKGWSVQEPFGTWSLGRKSSLYIPVGRLTKGEAADIALHLRIFSTSQRLAIRSGDEILFEGTLTPPGGEEPTRVVWIRVEPRHLEPSGYVRLELDHPDAVSPLSLRISNDPRKLAVALESAQVIPVP